MPPPRQSNGLSTEAPSPSTSDALRVARVRSNLVAVAASRPSITGIGRIALILPHISATRASTGRMRSPNARSTSRSRRSSAAAFPASRGLTRSMPFRISRSPKRSGTDPIMRPARRSGRPCPVPRPRACRSGMSEIDFTTRVARPFEVDPAERGEGKQSLEVGRRGFPAGCRLAPHSSPALHTPAEWSGARYSPAWH